MNDRCDRPTARIFSPRPIYCANLSLTTAAAAAAAVTSAAAAAPIVTMSAPDRARNRPTDRPNHRIQCRNNALAVSTSRARSFHILRPQGVEIFCYPHPALHGQKYSLFVHNFGLSLIPSPLCGCHIRKRPSNRERQRRLTTHGRDTLQPDRCNDMLAWGKKVVRDFNCETLSAIIKIYYLVSSFLNNSGTFLLRYHRRFGLRGKRRQDFPNGRQGAK